MPSPAVNQILRVLPYDSALLTNLVAAYPLEDAAGNPTDKSGNGNTLTNVNGVTQVAGPSSKQPVAANFAVANAQYYLRADTPSLSFGAGVPFWLHTVVNLTDKLALYMLVSKFELSVAGREFQFLYSNVSDRLIISASADGVVELTITANTLGAPSVATWYTVDMWCDLTNLNLAINNVAETPGALANIYDGGASLAFGARYSGGLANLHANAKMSQTFIWKRVPTAAERTFLYNDGQGRQFAQGRGFR